MRWAAFILGVAWGFQSPGTPKIRPLAAQTEVVASDAAIVRPQLDTRTYRIIRLANGLEALLVADPEADEAGAAISIKAGSFDDFEDRLGLAHFHEHMLFLGTEKYPEESSFDEFLQSAGGGSNAYTADDETNYFMSLNAEGLEEALDRLGQFFVAPRMTRDAVEREVEAVNSEYEMSLNDDGWRTLAILKALSDQNHPFARFSCGNKDTLLPDKVDDLWDALWKWNAKHYVAPKMRLCVVGRDIDELEHLVATSAFASIPTGKVMDDEKKTKTPWPSSVLARSTDIVPVRELRQVNILWPKMASKPGFDRLPDTIASHILGHEGTGSLHYVLREKGWIESLTFGTQFRFDDAQLVSLSLELTEKGHRRREDVLDLCFKWFGTIARSPVDVQRITDEWLSIARLRFDFAERESSADYFASSCAEAMWDYPDQPLVGPSLFTSASSSEKNHDLSDAVLDRVSEMCDPRNCFFIHLAPSESSSSESFETEPWHGGKYRTTELDDATLERYADASRTEEPELMLPLANPFIATDVTLRNQSKRGLFRASDSLWRRVDLADAAPTVRSAPKAVARVRLRSPEPLSASAIADARLFLKLVRSELNAEKYDAEMAGMYFDLRADSAGVRLGISGFNDKAHVAFEALVFAVVTAAKKVLGQEEELASPISFSSPLFSSKSLDVAEFERKFEIEKQELARKCDDRSRDEPAALASSFLSRTLDPDAMGFDELAESARKSTLQHAATTVLKLLETGTIEAYTAGNLGDDEAERFVTLTQKHNGNPQKEVRVRQLIAVPPGTDVAVEVRALRPSDDARPTFLGEKNNNNAVSSEEDEEPNSAVKMIWQLYRMGDDEEAKKEGWTNAMERDCAVVLMQHLAEPSAFYQLRTTEQLGYYVHTETDLASGCMLFGVTIQSAKVGPVELEERIRAWLDVFRSNLASGVITDADLETNKRGLSDAILKRPTCLAAVVDRDTMEITSGRRFFSRRRKRAAQIRDHTTREHLLKVVDAILSPNARLLKTRVFAPDLADAYDLDDIPRNAVRLRSFDDVRQFQNDLSRHPPPLRWNEAASPDDPAL